MACNHTVAEHNAMKLDGEWQKLEPAGYQPRYNAECDDLEMRNAECGSTLARVCVLTEEQREQVRAEVRARHDSFRARVQSAMAQQVAA